MKAHGPWKILATREVYRDPWMALTADEVVRPDGQPGVFAVLHVKPGVLVLALDDTDHVYLTREFRYGLGREVLEVVGGGREDEEEPLAAAQRELREEIGVEASEWTDLGSADPFTSMVVSPARLFLARRLRFGPPSQDPAERIECVKMPLTEAIAAVLEGRITHAPSGLLILKAHLLLEREKQAARA
jgi:ADP-ribose pyrophosphatase